MSLTRHALLATMLAVPFGVGAQEREPRSVDVLGLDQAVAIALDSNRQLKIAALEVERAQQRVAEARTKRLPTFNTYVLAAELITSLDFTVRAGQFGTFSTIGPVPSTDTKLSTAHGNRRHTSPLRSRNPFRSCIRSDCRFKRKRWERISLGRRCGRLGRASSTR